MSAKKGFIPLIEERHKKLLSNHCKMHMLLSFPDDECPLEELKDNYDIFNEHYSGILVSNIKYLKEEEYYFLQKFCRRHYNAVLYFRPKSGRLLTEFCVTEWRSILEDLDE